LDFKQEPFMAGNVAIIGASSDPSKFGNKAVRAYLRRGWTVFPVNPGNGVIEGLQVYRSIGEIPVPLDRTAMYVPPSVGLKLLGDIRAKGPGDFFLNPGSESPELIEKATELGLQPIVACSIVNIGERP
jgi:predicted CoA-binding protein